jgi:sulfur-carrier protein
LCYTLFMKIRIRYFASLREVVGQSEEIVTLHEGMTVADVRVMLSTRYPRLQPILERSLCAVNHGYVTTDTILHEGDELVFIPPMGGGNFWSNVYGTVDTAHS